MTLDITLLTLIVISLVFVGFFLIYEKSRNYIKKFPILLSISFAAVLFTPITFWLYEGSVSSDTEYLGGFMTEAELDARYLFSSNRDDYPAFITLYHIDSEAALVYFFSVMEKHGIF